MEWVVAAWLCKRVRFLFISAISQKIICDAYHILVQCLFNSMSVCGFFLYLCGEYFWGERDFDFIIFSNTSHQTFKDCLNFSIAIMFERFKYMYIYSFLYMKQFTFYLKNYIYTYQSEFFKFVAFFFGQCKETNVNLKITGRQYVIIPFIVNQK